MSSTFEKVVTITPIGVQTKEYRIDGDERKLMGWATICYTTKYWYDPSMGNRNDIYTRCKNPYSDWHHYFDWCNCPLCEDTRWEESVWEDYCD